MIESDPGHPKGQTAYEKHTTQGSQVAVSGTFLWIYLHQNTQPIIKIFG